MIITNDINKLLVNREYIDLLFQIYIQWSSDKIIECLPHFEKMALSQFKVYIEVEKMTQCYVCNKCNTIIFIQYSNDKEGGFGNLQILRIHTGLQKWNKKDLFHMILRDKNPVGINQPCIMIANNEVMFEKYRMALKREKSAIEIQGNDAIKRNQLFKQQPSMDKERLLSKNSFCI